MIRRIINWLKGKLKMGNNDDFKNDSFKLLKQVLLVEGARLSDEIDKIKRGSDADRTYFGYLKNFLIGSGCLADDIVNAAHNDAVLLAAIGTRVLLEDEINAFYLKSLATDADRYRVAADWLAVTNDPAAIKSNIDGKSVKKRAKDGGTYTEELYKGEYAFFCNYSHSTAHRGILELDDLRELGAKKSTLASLQAYWNILATIGDVAGQSLSDEAGEEVRAYLDKYKESVTEASLKLPIS